MSLKNRCQLVLHYNYNSLNLVRVKMLRYNFVVVDICHGNGTIAFAALCDLAYIFSTNFLIGYFTSKRWVNANITIAVRLEVRYLPLKGATANVVRRDLDLQFQGHEFEM